VNQEKLSTYSESHVKQWKQGRGIARFKTALWSEYHETEE